jgi:ATP-dependent RNA helicase SUPV3L1/SUV3
MWLGAETIRPLIRELVPRAEFIARPRLSTLRYLPPRKLSRRPRRSALIVFSVASVYEVAERVRHLRGGAALVFGALSPRTRSAQVGLYQSGEVDYLVATDAIGMGLNLDIDHVSLTALSKFDGRGPRALSPSEVAQIAGRAGRHVRDGTFGSTEELGPLPSDMIKAVESHRFRPLERLMWRHSSLSFASPEALLESLERRPPSPKLIRMRNAEDHRALQVLVRDQELMKYAQGPERVELLWDVCSVPDFRGSWDAGHTRFLTEVFALLAAPAGRLPEDWVAARVNRLDRVEGDVETLLERIAHVRTWTYVSHRSGWLADGAFWQERTRGIEDRLSDALHNQLTQQFVDRQASVLARHDPDELITALGEDGELFIQGLRAGRLEGFCFRPDPEAQSGARSLLAAANRTLRGSIDERVTLFEGDDDARLALSAEGGVSWRGAAIARLAASDDVLAPRVEVLQTDLLDRRHRERVRRRVAVWVERHLNSVLGPLLRARRAALPASTRGLIFALGEGLGSVPRRRVSDQVRALSAADRTRLRRLGIRIGRSSLYFETLLTREAVRLRGLLFSVQRRARELPVLGAETSLTRDPRVPDVYYAACGYQFAGSRWFRVDQLESVATAAREQARRGPFPAQALANRASCPSSKLSASEWAGVLRSLGYRSRPDGRFHWPERDRRRGRHSAKRAG